MKYRRRQSERLFRHFTAAVVTALLSICSALSYGQDLSDRQIVAVFAENAVTLPDSLSSGELGQVISPETGIDEILTSYGVTELSRAFPDFDRADTVGVAFTGEHVTLTDWSKIWLITLQSEADRDACIAALGTDPSTVFAEPNGGGVAFGAPQYPNDPQFKSGVQWGLWSPGPTSHSAKAAWAWGSTTGSPSIRIGIIDGGVAGNHVDLGSRVVFSDGTSADSRHAYMIAGIVGAITDNGEGVAGVDWQAPLVSVHGGYNVTFTVTRDAIIRASQEQGARVLNASWGLVKKDLTPDRSLIVQAAFKDHYALNGITVAAIGNSGNTRNYDPADYKSGVIAVGAASSSGVRWPWSTTGKHIDVLAPGVGILGPTENGGYVDSTGTSFAAPFVAGTASLLLAKRPSLNADDVKHLIDLSADDIAPAGYDTLSGYGMLNISRALSLLDPPNLFVTGTLATPYSQLGKGVDEVLLNCTVFGVLGVDDGVYTVRRRELFANMSFSPPFSQSPAVWGLGGGQVTDGWALYETNQERLITDYRSCLASNITALGCRLTTYIYEIPSGSGNWFPQKPQPDTLFHMSWSALLKAPELSPTTSFFIPQAGPVGSPLEGQDAIQYFRACPNNDGSALPNNARIKVIVKDGNGTGIGDIPASAIFCLLNGGTELQGRIGDGADSLIATSALPAPPNPTHHCPDLRAIEADAPTDASGATYITLKGATPGSPGMAARDPSRKWGHRDSEIPVFVLGARIRGRLTSEASPSDPEYKLIIKSFDHSGGLGTTGANYEVVNTSDFNPLAIDVENHLYDFWEDFNSDGVLDANDLNPLWYHMGHYCDQPQYP